jgi:hypothetical protein
VGPVVSLSGPNAIASFANGPGGGPRVVSLADGLGGISLLGTVGAVSPTPRIELPFFHGITNISPNPL